MPLKIFQKAADVVVGADERQKGGSSTEQPKHHPQIASDAKFEEIFSQSPQTQARMAVRVAEGVGQCRNRIIYFLLAIFRKGAHFGAKAG